MKKRVNGFIVVEGAADKAFLLQILDCSVIELRGFAVPCGTLEYLKMLSKHKNMIIMTDPDEAGNIIAKRLKNQFENAYVVNVDFCPREGTKKHGIAETSKESVLSALKDFLIDESDPDYIKKGDEITLKTLYEITPKDSTIEATKSILKNHYNLGKCNTKLMLERLNYLDLKIEEIKDTILHGN